MPFAKCPKCGVEYKEAGFCPHDGSALAIATEEFDSDDLATLSESIDDSVFKNVKDAHDTSRLIGAELDGRYKIEKQIGEGGMGVVFLARHMVIEKQVAVKVLRAEVASDEGVVKRFVQEAQAASRVGHPNIIDVTDFGTTDSGLTYQVMEYLEGQTLAKLLHKEKNLDLPRALAIFAQMARALDAAHAKGNVHRDLKPENIFLMDREGRDDYVKIVDFGIAKVQPKKGNTSQPRLTREGTVFGTPEYMSPEHAAGRGDVDRRADVYALGIMLYEMLCGKVPLRGNTTVRTLAMQMLDKPKTLHEACPGIEISEELDAVIMHSLAKKKEERYQTMSEFLDAVEGVTTANELDLPELVKQERLSSEMLSRSNIATISEASGQVPPTEADASAVPKRNRGRVTDPVFLQDVRAPSYDLVEKTYHETSAPQPSDDRARSEIWIALVALLVVGGGVFFVLNKSDDKPNGEAPALAAGDTVANDAGPDNLSDAGHVGSIDAGADSPTPTAKSKVALTIKSRPPGARFFVNKKEIGKDGVELKEKPGTELAISCRLRGYKNASVIATFDGTKSEVTCRLKLARKKNCAKGTLNPYDDCP